MADGVRKGDRVAIIMRNLPEWSVAFWAASLVGAIVTPLNAWWTGPELEYGLTDACKVGAGHLVSMWGHPDQSEGPRAFAEKREPNWAPLK